MGASRARLPAPRVAESTAGAAAALVLHDYARRGVISALRQVAVPTGSEFDFGWLYDQPYTLACHDARARLRLLDLLPRVERDTMLYREVQEFIKQRASPDAPAHRRVDPGKAVLSGVLSQGALSLDLTLTGAEDGAPDFEYGTRKLINVAHELFLFLNEFWPDYMWANFHLHCE